MVDIVPQIIGILDAVSYNFPNVKVDRTYKLTTSDMDNPLIAIAQVNNTERSANQTLSGSEKFSNITLQIEVYSPQQLLEDAVKSPADVVSDISISVNAIMDTTGFKRVQFPQMVPAKEDGTVMRQVMRFRTIYDLAANYFIKPLED